MRIYILVLMILLSVKDVGAQSIYYLKGALGPSWQQDNSFAGGEIDYDPSGLGHLLISVGLNIGPQVSAEVEFSVRSLDVNSIDNSPYLADLDSSSIMFNGIYSIPLKMGYSFIAGAGFGVLTAELNDVLSGNYADGSALATQFMLGLEAEVTDELSFCLEYKKISTFDLELSGTSGVFNENFNFKSGSVLVGLKYNF